VAMEKEIRSMSMEPHGFSTSAPWRSITNLTLAVGVDFDFRDKKIFYTYVGIFSLYDIDYFAFCFLYCSDMGVQDIFSFDMDDPNPHARQLVQSNVTGTHKQTNILFVFKV